MASTGKGNLLDSMAPHISRRYTKLNAYGLDFTAWLIVVSMYLWYYFIELLTS